MKFNTAITNLANLIANIAIYFSGYGRKFFNNVYVSLVTICFIIFNTENLILFTTCNNCLITGKYGEYSLSLDHSYALIT